MDNKNYGLWGGVTLGVIVIVLGLMWFVGSTPIAVPGGNIVPPVVTEADWQTGNSTMPVTIVEYSDFQCPACRAYYSVLKRLEAEYASSTNFVYRHFPLAQHLDAQLAAYAVEAAGTQGKFFEMHDILFEKQGEWGIDSSILPTDPKELTASMRTILETKLFGYAESLNLDMQKFKADMVSTEIHDKVTRAIADGKSLGIPATPTFFLNGKQLANPNGYDEFKNLIDAALKKS